MEETQAPVEQPTGEVEQQQVPDFKSTKHRVKIEGGESEVTYEELLNGYQMRQASQRRFEEAAQRQKQAEQFFDAIKKDPITAMKQLNVDFDSAAEAYYAEKLKLEMMDPKERALLEKEKELSEYKKKEADYKKDLETREIAALQSQALKEIDVEIGEVLRKSGTKSSPKVVARLAELMLASLEKGERMPADKAYAKTYSDLKDEVITFTGSLPPAELVKVLPKEQVDALRKYFVSEVTDNKPFTVRRNQTPSAVKKSEPVKNTDEFFKRLESKFNS
jgi:hypothetical protein